MTSHRIASHAHAHDVALSATAVFEHAESVVKPEERAIHECMSPTKVDVSE